MNETSENKTNEIEHELLPENTITLILKADGKVYSIGANIGNIVHGIPDEDLDSTLRAVRGLCVNLLRTIAVQLGGKPEEYPLPNIDAEQDDGPTELLLLADETIEKGQPAVVDVELGRVRNATDEEVTRSDTIAK